MIKGRRPLDIATATEHAVRMNHRSTRLTRFAHRTRELLEGLRDYFGSASRRRREEPIADRAALRRFLETRASYVAQTSLYGYLRTRAGMIYPQLFENDEFVQSVNIAKWHVWLACLADLSVYAGGLLARATPEKTQEIGALMQELVGAILEETGTPTDAGPEFGRDAERVRARLAACDWTRIEDDETPFSASPTALIRWAPIVDSLKELDEEIVRNSVRFRWQEVRRALRNNLDVAGVLDTPR